MEYVNDVNREHTEVLMELNINGIMDTAYSYGNERLTNERFTGWTGYYTYDPRGSVTGVTDSEGMIWQSYRYDANGSLTFGKPQYNNVYSYNAESYNPNVDAQYLRARYYSPGTANFLTEDSYLGKISDPLTLNRYNYVKSSPLNYIDPSGNYTTDEGNEAHTVLQGYLTLVLGDSVESERVIAKIPIGYTEGAFYKQGRADIVFNNGGVHEVYEIKPYSYYKDPGLNKDGRKQREEYVTGLRNEGLVVDSHATTLNLFVDKLVLPSVKYKNRYIKYYTDQDQPGMIYYSYVSERQKQESLEESVELAKELLRALSCAGEIDLNAEANHVFTIDREKFIETVGSMGLGAGAAAALYYIFSSGGWAFAFV